jgi:formylglycine-generating enzyme
MADVFLSYASSDRERIKPLVKALTDLGWSVWWDPKIRPGEIWDQVIESELEAARCVVVVWTSDSVAKLWVRTEAEEGRRRGILVPVLLEEARIPLAFRHLQSANLARWAGEMDHAQFEQLAESIAAIVPRAKAAAAHVEPPPYDARVNPRDGQTYLWIPPGTFTMGASEGDEEAEDDEYPAHRVTLTRGFWIGQTPVAIGAYARFQGKQPEEHPERPQANVSWHDAMAFCEYAGMRLPAEAEWEYAARGGTTGPRYGGLNAVAWHTGNSHGRQHPLRAKPANPWGLYDALGTVWEWVADWYGSYCGEPVADPTGPPKGDLRVVRGGSILNPPRVVRVSCRARYEPEHRENLIGFRCAGDLL